MLAYHNVRNLAELWEDWNNACLRLGDITLGLTVEHRFEYQTMAQVWRMICYPCYNNLDGTTRLGNKLEYSIALDNQMIEQLYCVDQLKNHLDHSFRQGLFEMMEEAKKDLIYSSTKRAESLDHGLPPATATETLKRERF